MLTIKTTHLSSRVPLHTLNALDEYAEAIIQDFMPERLHSPGPLDVTCFTEQYLCLRMDFCRICDYLSHEILALTAFRDAVVQVIGNKTNNLESLAVKKGTVLIHTSLADAAKETRRRFTVAHEGAHWLIHRGAFEVDKPSSSTDINRLERQANYLAAAILMPRTALRVSFKDFFSFYSDTPRRIIRGASPISDCYATQLPQYIASIFNVSSQAAKIRLEMLNAIVDMRWRREPLFYI